MARPTSLPLAIALTAAWALCVSQAATAGTVSLTGDPRGERFTLTFQASAGEANRLSIALFQKGIPQWSVSDPGAGITPGEGCRNGLFTTDAVCFIPPLGRADAVVVDLGDGDDWASLEEACGADEVAVECRLTGRGGDGNDRLVANATRPEESRLFGGAGDDHLLGWFADGGLGADTLSGQFAIYSNRANPVSVSLNDVRDDGEAGEQDLAVDVTGVVGGQADDVLVGDARANRLDGGQGGDLISGGAGDDDVRGDAGDDHITGGAGDDDISGDPLRGRAGGADLLVGGGGRDVVWGAGGNDRIAGGPGPDGLQGGYGDDALAGGGGHDRIFGHLDHDRLAGGLGNDYLHADFGRDTLIGGRGRDNLIAGPGNDTFFARDGYRDRLDGYRGIDRARIDRRLDRRRFIERLF